MNKKPDIWSILAVLIALLALIFGDNIYERITGHAIFPSSPPASPSPSLIPTEAITVASSPSSTSVPTPSQTNLPNEISDTFSVTMRLVPEGEFIMGSDSNFDTEKPSHLVNLDAYYIDKYEVTNAFYRACVEAGDCTYIETYSPESTVYLDDITYQNYPVFAVDWNSAWTYCNWRGMRLPTEAEWEKAARGTDGRIYPWGNNINNARANYDLNVGDIVPVGSYEGGVSIYGIYDMAGNVWEWVNSQYKDYPYDSNDGRENLNPSGIHVLRGGDFSQPADFVRSSHRFPLAPPDILIMTGIRCAKDAAP